MLRRTLLTKNFTFFGNTKLGKELSARTSQNLKEILNNNKNNNNNNNNNINIITRFLTRRRKIDEMQIEVNEKITKELHPSFKILINIFTFLVTTPILSGLLSGKITPSIIIVWFGFTTREKWEKIWEFAHWGVILSSQLLLFIIYYDFSVYIRFPVFYYVFAPIYRKFGLFARVPEGALGIEELKKGGGRKIIMKSRRVGMPLGKSISNNNNNNINNINLNKLNENISDKNSKNSKFEDFKSYFGNIGNDRGLGGRNNNNNK